MRDKKFWLKAINLGVLVLTIVFFVSPVCAAENYTIGIVGIDSRIKDKNLNLGDYTDLTQLENPLVYAQKIFTEILTTDLPTIGLEGVDKTANATSKRIAEVNFQMDLGNPAEAMKLFDAKLDYLIYGYITNMTVTHRESIAGSNLTVRIDLTTRIIDASTGKVVCIATGKGESASHGGAYRKSFKLGGSEISEECWHEALEKALNQIVEKIKKQV
ncbi:MAG: hypothetical protein IJ685_02660 [Selenomonadaceae bacterium]|nr:hypothetical protein [Selenomonadaceae bacterium]